MKIAAITEDGKTISRHFGRAPYFLVATVENGQVVNRELRDKPGHDQFQQEGYAHDEVGGAHGFGPAADHRHVRMTEAIADCEAVLCGGMGKGAYESIRACNIRPVITDIVDIDEATAAYASEKIIDHLEKLH
jgi:predicted Fe-Mo cluster-binding NifX family protein